MLLINFIEKNSETPFFYDYNYFFFLDKQNLTPLKFLFQFKHLNIFWMKHSQFFNTRFIHL